MHLLLCKFTYTILKLLQAAIASSIYKSTLTTLEEIFAYFKVEEGM